MALHEKRAGGGLESVLGALAGAEGQASAGPKDMGPKDLHRILMSTLMTHGLQATAQVLRSEAELNDIPSAPARGPDSLSLANTEAHQVATAQRRRVAECAEVVSEQRQRLDVLREKVKQLREARGGQEGGKTAALAEHASRVQAQDRRIEELKSQCEQLRAMEAPLREELRSKAEEAIALKELIAKKKADGADMQHRLQRAKQEVAELSLQKKQQAAAPAPQPLPAVYAAPPPARTPVSPTGAEPACTPIPQKHNPETDKIQWIIAHWEHPHGPVNRVAPRLFAHADTDHDERLRWNEGEIRQFVHDLFKHYELHLPQWQDHVWYELYRQCDQNMDYALELRETMDFAKHCFELALHSYATVTGHSAHQPLGHGYKEMEVAATIQSVLASALNPSAGGALYNVSVDIFQQLDYNHDGRIEWNNGEVKGFVTNLFSRYGVPMPQWPDQVWYDMYHKCDIEGRHSINLQEGMMFARCCFEAAMHALVIATPH